MNLKSQSGNVLFLILIAVALFAALSYAVTQSTRGGNGTGNEALRLEIARIDNFHVALKAAIQRMIVLEGFEPSEIDFRPYQGTAGNLWLRNNGAVVMDANNNCTSDACRLFHAGGGKVHPIILSDEVLGDRVPRSDSVELGHAAVEAYRMGNVGTQNRDVVLIFSYVSDQFCEAFNEAKGVEMAGNLPLDQLESSGGVMGDFSFNDDGLFGVGNTAPQLLGHRSFCRTGNQLGVPFNHINLVLIER